MKRKILITLVVLAAGFVALLAYEWSSEMVQNNMGFFHAPAFVSSALSSVSPLQVGIIVMVVVITVAVIAFREGDTDKM